MASALDMNDIESLKDLHPRNRIPDSDYVPGHVLCERCSRIRDKSAILNTSHSDHETDEVFFHSKNLRQLFESSAAGCHLCTIMSGSIELGDVGDQSDGGIICLVDSTPPNTGLRRLVWIALRQLDQNGQAVIHTERDYSRIDELLAACGYINTLIYSREIGKALIGEIDDQDILFPPPTTSSGRLLPTSTGSPEMIDVMRSWLHQCLHDHPQCYPLDHSTAGSQSGSKGLPTRLIDIGEESGQLKPRLVLPSVSVTLEKIQYLTLSHAWSITVEESHLKLLMNNIEDLQVDIPLEKLSQTFRDSMAVTQQLGYRYIWIDSLCIIQDSTEDWEKESVTMCDVYGRSILTIAASGMNGLDLCFRRRNPLLVTPCYLGELQRGIYAYPFFYNNHQRLMVSLTQEGARLPSRGWFLQERLLSPRTLYLGAPQLYWECSSQTWCESIPSDETMVLPIRSWHSEKAAFHTLCRWSLNDATLALTKTRDEVLVTKKKAIMLYKWVHILKIYSESHLTYTKDRLIALSGIIEAIQKGTTWTPVAGTWKELWPLDLLWFFYDSKPEAKKLVSGLNTPSWSWLTKEGPKRFPVFHTYSSSYRVAQVIGSTAQSAAMSKHYIWEVEGETTITLKGYVRRAVWADGRINEKGPFHWSEGSTHHSESIYEALYWDDPPADGDAFLFLLILAGYDSKHSQYFGLILTTAHSGESDGKTGDHYRRVGMFEEYTRSNDGGTRFVEGAQEEVVTIC